jgi:myb proto-oncogene protein
MYSTLFPSRTNIQCSSRWHDTLDPSVDRTPERSGTWTADEDDQLKDAVQRHSGKNWKRIAVMVPGRTKMQCRSRWHHALGPRVDRTSLSSGKWTDDEDNLLKDAVQRYGGKSWIEIAALVSGRTKIQCSSRWHNALDPSVDRTSLATGKWTAEEDNLLKDAVQRYGSKNWKYITAMVPGRTKIQCRRRWHDALDPNVDMTSLSTGKWTADEDNLLKDAVQRHRSKNWTTIAALVPGRTKIQCKSRWYNATRSVPRCAHKMTQSDDGP